MVLLLKTEIEKRLQFGRVSVDEFSHLNQAAEFMALVSDHRRVLEHHRSGETSSQALTGRLLSRAAEPQQPMGLVRLLFILSLLFWLAVLWATYQVEILHSCSGDNCFGYMLLAMPFPFAYGLAELMLFRTRRSPVPTP